MPTNEDERIDQWLIMPASRAEDFRAMRPGAILRYPPELILNTTAGAASGSPQTRAMTATEMNLMMQQSVARLERASRVQLNPFIRYTPPEPFKFHEDHMYDHQLHVGESVTWNKPLGR